MLSDDDAVLNLGKGAIGIMSRTGHRSTDGVRCYKRPAPLLEYQVSEILNPPQKLEASTSNSTCIPAIQKKALCTEGK